MIRDPLDRRPAALKRLWPDDIMGVAGWGLGIQGFVLMIIDVHTQIWSRVDQLGSELAEAIRVCRTARFGQLDASPASLEQAMSCVDGALVFGFRCDRLNAHVPNELIADFVAREPRRRIGIAGIDPMADDAIDQLEHGVEMGLAGAAMSPAAQGFHPSHSSAMRVYERCVEMRLPVFFTMPVPPTPSTMMTFAQPTLYDEIALNFPDLPIVINQIGHPWIEETLFLLAKHRNVYADIAGVTSRQWQLYHALQYAMNFGVMDKLLFASGFPHETPTRVIESLYTINSLTQGTQLPTIPRSQVRQIVERDALSRLGLASEITPRDRAGEPGPEQRVTTIDIETTNGQPSRAQS